MIFIIAAAVTSAAMLSRTDQVVALQLLRHIKGNLVEQCLYKTQGTDRVLSCTGR